MILIFLFLCLLFAFHVLYLYSSMDGCVTSYVVPISRMPCSFRVVLSRRGGDFHSFVVLFFDICFHLHVSLAPGRYPSLSLVFPFLALLK